MSTLTCRHVGAKLHGLSRTTTGGGVTNNKGGQEYSASVRNSAGNTTHTFRQPFYRGCVAVLANGATVPTGGFPINVAGSATAVQFETRDGAGAGQEGTGHALIYGFNDRSISAGLKQDVKGYFERPQIVKGTISAAGAETIPSRRYRVALTSTSTYTITFEPAFGSAPVVIPTVIGATALSAKVTSVTARTCVIDIASTGGVATASAFGFVAYGSRAPNEVGLANTPIEVSGLQQELVGGKFNGATATIGIGTYDYTIVRNSAGNYSVTFSRPFRDVPVVVCSSSGRAQLLSAPTKTGFVMGTFSAGGVAADSSDCNFLTFGSFDSIEI